MNPKEKALDLFHKMNNQEISIQEWEKASDYAKKDLKRKVLIAVDEIIRETKIHDETFYHHSRTVYWMEVKQEINIL